MATLMIPGPAGVLEARYHAPIGGGNPLGKILIVSPHPEREGDMDHKVVYSLYRVFASLKFHVLRFNFRGCGKSQGRLSQSDEEISDAAACLDWLTLQNQHLFQSNQPIWIAGFSFGAWVAMQVLMRRPECARFISVSPPVGLYDFSFLAPCPRPGLVLHAENDFVTSKENILRFVHQLSLQKKGEKVDLKMIANADREFTHTLKELENIIFSHSLSMLQQDIESQSAKII